MTIEKLHAGRAAMAERCRHVAELLAIEAGVETIAYRKGLTGRAWSKEKRISVPEPTTRRRLYIFAHECAHVALKHSRDVPVHRREFECEQWATDALRRHLIAVPKKSKEAAIRYVAMKIERARKRGAKEIDREALEFSQGGKR